MRLRTDSIWDAGAKRAVLLGARPDPRVAPPVRGTWSARHLEMLNDDAAEPAAPGDVWRIRGGMSYDNIGEHSVYVESWSETQPDWAVIGYGLWCPQERCPAGTHRWTHASDCPGIYDHGKCKYHRDSCWEWAGSPETGDLTASPSLHVTWEPCGWHGHLQAGQMVAA